MLYENGEFTEQERARLAPYFTNLDRPVFALINLPETVKGALFARYSRYPGSLRRLFLDEFADQLPDVPPDWSRAESRRAKELYERVFLGYGDDSVAQLGGAHVACEWVSNVLTKILQRPRLASYLEQSTRYMAYDQRMPDGHYRYYRDPLLGPEYADAMDKLFEIYSNMLTGIGPFVAARYQRMPSEPPEVHARAVKAKTFDLCRGLLPAASLSHMGIYASGQAYEQLILHLFAHPLPEARLYGEMLLRELKHVIPSFLTRLERVERSSPWLQHYRRRARTETEVAERMGLAKFHGDAQSSVTLVDHDGDEADLLAAMLFEGSGASEVETRRVARELDENARSEAILTLVGARENRRYKPSRGFERVRYRFEIQSDYAAFRDLQRHRMLTAQWQQLTPDLGATIPEEVFEAGLDGEFRRGLEISQREYERLAGEGLGQAASYALCFAYHIRYVLHLNAREAIHLIELRSGREGHPSYRQVAQDMFRQISDCHPTVAKVMTHVNLESSECLERRDAEARSHARSAGPMTASAPDVDADDGSADDRLFGDENVDPDRTVGTPV